MSKRYICLYSDIGLCTAFKQQGLQSNVKAIPKNCLVEK